ncbi:MAG: kynureninase [Halobacteriales archaeon]
MTDREDARRRDRTDPLADVADRFEVPGEQYLDGNSLGPASDAAVAALDRAVDQWRELGIRAWTDADPPWYEYGERLGNRLADLVGADPPEVVAANTTTVNVHSTVGTFLNAALSGDARTATGDPVEGAGVVVNELDFPTDHYAIRAQMRARGLDPAEHFHVVESPDGRTIDPGDVEAVLAEESVGALFFPSALYRSGQLFDLSRLTDLAHEHGAFAGFDLAHSIGVMPHDLSAAGVDFAVWCSYKYLNAGPGAVAGLYVNAAHFGRPPGLPGWWGHEAPFDLAAEHVPDPSAAGWQIGTVNVLSAAPLFGALDVVETAGIEPIREGSLARTRFLIDLVDEKLSPHGYEVGTPRAPARRGGHVAVEHPEAARISEALRDRGTVVDFRPPDVVRVAPNPLYVSFEDVYDAVERMRRVVADGVFEEYAVPDGVS